MNESIELKSEDDISLLDTAVLGTEEERNEMAHVSFKLQRILPVILLRIQTTPIRDDESTDNVLKIDIDNKKHKVKDEVKVKAKDNNNNNRIDKTMTHKYAEDYEQGEPSGVNCTKQKAPKNLKPPTDPVSKVIFFPFKFFIKNLSFWAKLQCILSQIQFQIRPRTING